MPSQVSGGKLAVFTDAGTACAGDIISGRVYFVLKKPLASGRLMLEFFGRELTHLRWHSTGGDDGSPNQGSDGSMQDTHPLLEVEWVLADYTKTGCEPGEYEFPFSFRLPGGLPPTLCEAKPTKRGDPRSQIAVCSTDCALCS